MPPYFIDASYYQVEVVRRSLECLRETKCCRKYKFMPFGVKLSAVVNIWVVWFW